MSVADHFREEGFLELPCLSNFFISTSDLLLSVHLLEPVYL